VIEISMLTMTDYNKAPIIHWIMGALSCRGRIRTSTKTLASAHVLSDCKSGRLSGQP